MAFQHVEEDGYYVMLIPASQVEHCGTLEAKARDLGIHKPDSLEELRALSESQSQVK